MTETALEAAIANTIGAMPEHWVLVVADVDGEVHGLASPGMPLWQRMGLLQWDASSYGAQPVWTLCDHEEEDDE